MILDAWQRFPTTRSYHLLSIAHSLLEGLFNAIADTVLPEWQTDEFTDDGWTLLFICRCVINKWMDSSMCVCFLMHVCSVYSQIRSKPMCFAVHPRSLVYTWLWRVPSPNARPAKRTGCETAGNLKPASPSYLCVCGVYCTKYTHKSGHL